MEISIKLLKIQNQWWDSGNLKYDLVLKALEAAPLKFRPKYLEEISLQAGQITLIEGSRGVGKTSAMKILIDELISVKNVVPQNIFYYSCHNLDSNEQLNELIKTFVNWRRGEKDGRGLLYIFIDEISFIANWEKGLRYLKEAGLLKNVSLVLSGSHQTKLSDDTNRSGLKIKTVQGSGLSFSEFICLLDKSVGRELLDKPERYSFYQKRLDYYLDVYLLSGGYISAINSFSEHSYVRQEIYSSYMYFLIADVARIGRDLILFRQIIEQIISLQNTPFGYKSLVKKTKAQTHNTVNDYIKILQSMFSVQLMHQYDKDEGISRSSNKKLYFRDPFIYWVYNAYLHGSLSYWQFSRDYIHEAEIFSCLLNNTIFSHLLKKECAGSWEESVVFWRDARRKEEIPFISFEKGRANPILLRYKEKISDNDLAIFKRAGFKGGTIITRNILDHRGDIKIVPLSNFLFFS